MTEEPQQDEEIDRLLAEIFEAGSGEALDELLRSVENPGLLVRELTTIAEHEAHVFGLATAWRQHYRRTGDTDSLDHAIAEFERCASLLSADHSEYARVMTEIGLTLRLRFELSGTRADVERAVEVLAAAFETPAEDPSVRAGRARNLGIALQERYESTDQGDDLDQAIELFRAAVRDVRSPASLHGNLGNALRVRFVRTRDRADLDAAIAEDERAVALDPEGGDPRVLNHFGLAMELRSETVADPADLDRAIELFETALSRVPDQSLDQAMFSANLGRALWSRYGRTDERADLEAAAAAYRLVLQSEFMPYGRRPSRVLYSYAFMLLELLRSPDGEAFGPAPEAADAVRAFDEALEVFPAGSDNHGRLLGGRRSALSRLPHPTRSANVRLGGRTAFVLTAEHRGSIRRVVTILPKGGEILIGFGADPSTVRFADTMSYVDRAYPDGDTYPTWLAIRLPAARREVAREIVLRYHADEPVDDGELALHALRSTAEPPASHGPYTPPGTRLRAQVLVGHFAGTERYLVLMGEEVETWLGIESDPVEALSYFITTLSAAVTAVPDARVIGVQGGVVQYFGDLPEPRSPREIAEEGLAQVGPGGGEPEDDGPFDPAGYDEAGREALTWNGSGVRILETFERTGDPALPARAVTMFRTAVGVLPETHPHRPVHLVNLAVLLYQLYESTDDVAALRESTQVWRELVRAPDVEWRYHWRLGADLTMLSELLDDPEPLADAIAELRVAALMAEPGSLDEAGVLDALSSAHRVHAVLTGDDRSATEAVATGRRAVSVRADHPERLGHLNHLAGALRVNAELTDAPAQLDEAIELLRQVIADTAPDAPNLGTRLHNLGVALWSRSADGDFEEALGLLRRAVREQPADEPNRDTHLSGLARALTLLFEETHDRELLDEALTAQRAAVESTPLAAGIRPERLLTLSALLNRRYERSGSDAALEENVAIVRDFVARYPDHPEGPRLLGRVLTTRYRRHGELGDLADAIDTLRTAAEQPAQPPVQALTLTNLVLALVSRYNAAGDLAALREAVELARRAVTLTPDDSPDLPGMLSNVANVCRMLFERTQGLVLLIEAIEAGRQAVAGRPAGVMDRVGALTNLGLALTSWSRATGDEAAGAEAVELLRQAVELTPPDYHDRGLYLSNLGNVLAAHDPAQAIETARRAVETTPYGAARAERLTNLLARLIDRLPGTLDEVIRTARSIVEIDLATPIIRVRAAGLLGAHLAKRGDWAEAARAFTLAVELLPTVAPRDLPRADQEYGLVGLGPLAEDGAACAVRSGDPELALRLLEQGRGILLGQALDDRSDVSALRRRSAELADRFERLRDRLGDPAVGTDAARIRLARQWQELLDEIRSAPDWSDFLRPPPLSGLLPQAGRGPIAVINLSSYGSDALLVSTGGVQAVPLPDLTPEALIDVIAVFWERQRAMGDISEVLHWLWDAVAEPVLAALGLTGAPQGRHWPRLWWSPAGLLALLPLHAAGHHTGGRAVLDRAISSYTPTIRALQYARSRAVGGRTDSRDVVVVSVPDAPGTVPLPGVRRETESLVRRFPDATVLAGPDATHDRVLAALGSHRVAHFACHAAADPAQPSQGHLVLWDYEERPLTVLELGRHDLGRAQLAYLSACETAGGSRTLINEALHITAACQLAGFPHVIGTLWPISDRFAAQVADEVYAALSRRGKVNVAQAPAALHQVIRQARGRHPGRAGLWAAFLHYGP
ncbi:CHAT domain-containing protein [Streptosporangium subroseum]|uniref:CHAT domain-containing protein n=1 Tax=Streptosporangium subroseum TaxID=106412 RepID=UPI00308A9AB0|nr:CHAT domain-containing protein [Streptosporangium subroseum]